MTALVANAADAEALADMLLELAERDPALLRRLDLAARVTGVPAAEHVARLREMLLGTLLPRRSIDYDEADNWTATILDTLGQIPTR